MCFDFSQIAVKNRYTKNVGVANKELMDADKWASKKWIKSSLGGVSAGRGGQLAAIFQNSTTPGFSFHKEESLG